MPAIKGAISTGPFALAIAGGGSTGGAAVAALSYNAGYLPAMGGYMLLKMKDSKDAVDGITSLIGGNTYYSESLRDGGRRARDDD